MKKLNEEQIEARLTMYEEAAGHLELSVCDSETEREQAIIVSKQIRSIAERFKKIYAEKLK